MLSDYSTLVQIHLWLKGWCFPFLLHFILNSPLRLFWSAHWAFPGLFPKALLLSEVQHQGVETSCYAWNEGFFLRQINEALNSLTCLGDWCVFAWQGLWLTAEVEGNHRQHLCSILQVCIQSLCMGNIVCKQMREIMFCELFFFNAFFFSIVLM